MVTCEICDKELKNPQGLSGHRRLAHGLVERVGSRKDKVLPGLERSETPLKGSPDSPGVVAVPENPELKKALAGIVDRVRLMDTRTAAVERGLANGVAESAGLRAGMGEIVDSVRSMDTRAANALEDLRTKMGGLESVLSNNLAHEFAEPASNVEGLNEGRKEVAHLASGPTEQGKVLARLPVQPPPVDENSDWIELVLVCGVVLGGFLLFRKRPTGPVLSGVVVGPAQEGRPLAQALDAARGQSWPRGLPERNKGLVCYEP